MMDYEQAKREVEESIVVWMEILNTFGDFAKAERAAGRDPHRMDRAKGAIWDVLIDLNSLNKELSIIIEDMNKLQAVWPSRCGRSKKAQQVRKPWNQKKPETKKSTR